MRIILSTIIFSFVIIAQAQNVTFSIQQHVFDTLNENGIDSVQIKIQNNIGTNLDITGISSLSPYGDQAFFIKDTLIIIPPSYIDSTMIYFKPSHNVFYDSELIFHTNSLGDFSVDLKGQGQYSNTYYSNTANLSEETLKSELKSITGNQYTQLSYNNARDLMYMLIDNQMINGGGAAQNTLECVYTGRIISGYQNRTQAQQGPYDFNTEHTYPQSLFSSALPMKSDLFHIFPTDITSNSKRGSYPFGMVNGSISWQNGGSKLGVGIFEPRDEQKGAVARAMMYFVTRYQDYNFFFNGQDSILRKWNTQFPPDIVETNRNNDIYSYQNNRNPFIDYPQFADRISDFSTFSSAPIIHEMSYSPDSIEFGVCVHPVNKYFNICLNNSGNQPIMLSAYQFSNPGILSLTSAFSQDTIIAPGDSYNATILLSNIPSSYHGLDLQESLTFSINDTTVGDFVIPIHAFYVYSGIEEAKVEHFLLFQDNNNLEIKTEWDLDINTFRVFNASGQQIPINIRSKNRRNLSLDISTYSPGVYILMCQNKNNYIRSQKFIKD